MFMLCDCSDCIVCVSGVEIVGDGVVDVCGYGIRFGFVVG